MLTQWSDFKKQQRTGSAYRPSEVRLKDILKANLWFLKGGYLQRQEDIRELNTEMNLGLEALIERSITANENLVFKHTFNEQVENWIAKTDPTNVLLNRTPESAEEELSS